MRRKKISDPIGYGRLLDAWIPPAHAGEALGCFTTTFTFHASFFETECLGRMLQLECDPESSGAAYLIEREEKMARLISASVVVDRSHAHGQRSLRWDLIPFRTKIGILHAKLSILLWQHHARVIVASANLTENGYRQNLEVFTTLDFCREGQLPAELFSSAASFASDVLTQCEEFDPGVSPARNRSRELIATARRKVAAWLPAEVPMPRSRTALIPVTPKSPSLLENLRQLWPSASPPNELYVLSPFFDQSPENRPAKEVWGILRQRGDAEVFYSVVAEPTKVAGQLLVHAPSSLISALPDSNRDAKNTFERLKMPEGRPLHAKSLWLQGSDHYLHSIGSSNFTSAGLGLSPVRNWELNIASWGRLDNSHELKARNAAWPEREAKALDPDAVKWEPLVSLEDEANPESPVLPDWCGSAVYYLREDDRGALELTLGNVPPAQWTVLDSSGSKVMLDGNAWLAMGAPTQVQLLWTEIRPPTELIVRIGGINGEAKWPVEVRSFTDLPPPQELQDLSLDQLLEILTSSLPLHRCLQKLWRSDRGEADVTTPTIALDPLRRFSRDAHLLERTRRFSLAMAGLRRRLEAPIPSDEYLQWRLYGPIGVAKIATAIVREASSDGERAFLLGELAIELSQVQPRNDTGCIPRKRVVDALNGLITDFEKQATPLLAGTDATLREYVTTALRKARE